MEKFGSQNEDMLKYLHGEMSFTEWNTSRDPVKEMDVEITGQSEATELVAEIKEEPIDDFLEESNTGGVVPASMAEVADDVIYMGTEIVIRYLQGEITFAEFNSILESEVKDDCDDDELGVALNQEIQTQPSTSAEPDKQATDKSPKSKRPIARLPKNAQGLMGEANMRYARGEKDDAIKICMEVIKMAPKAPEPYQTVGMIYEENGDAERALQFMLIAAHLNRDNPDEWVQLAEMSLDQKNITQAISCYDRAIKLDKKNVAYYWARCDLLTTEGESKKVIEGHETILTLLPNEEGAQYFKLAVDLTTSYHTDNDMEKAMVTLSKAFDLHPGHVTVEGINMLLELLISKQLYGDAILATYGINVRPSTNKWYPDIRLNGPRTLRILIRHCGTVLYFGDDVIRGSVELAPQLPTDDIKPTKCEISEEMLVDLRAKLAICCIHLGFDECIDTAMCKILTDNVEDIGDIYLDIAEAYTDRTLHAAARPLLYALVNTENYNLAAVWLQYAECLNSLGDLSEAAHAFQQVLEQVPSHRSARLSLSAIQQQLGKPEEALNVLQQAEQETLEAGEESLSVDLQLHLPKCMLLYSQKRWALFIAAAKDVLFGHIPMVFNSHMQKILIGTRSIKHRMENIRSERAGQHTLFEKRLRELDKAISKETLVTHDTLWNLLLKLMEVMMDAERYEDMQDIGVAALIHPAFLTEEKQRDLGFIIIHTCLLGQRGTIAFDFIRDLCLEDIENNQAWNLFAQVICISQNMRHNRFCLRLMFKYPDHKALGILNGHNALVAGTYKHALAEYVSAFRNRPHDPFLSFCLGITFVHLASQKFAAKRHSLTVQACAFFNQYLELRGECQETYYNLGRAMHQLALYHAAVYYYEKGLECPPMIPGKSMFDLSREIAFNLCIIYKHSGSYEQASLITQKYLVI